MLFIPECLSRKWKEFWKPPGAEDASSYMYLPKDYKANFFKPIVMGSR